MISKFCPVGYLNFYKNITYHPLKLILFYSLYKIGIRFGRTFFIKGYLRYKSILCHKVALDVQLMNFFIWRENNFSFSRYQDFCVFVKPPDFKICLAIISIAA